MIQKWEYLRVETGVDPTGKDFTRFVQVGTEKNSLAKLEETLNEIGDQGWELVATSGTIDREVFTFKRPKV